jgi:PKD repeat protein
LQFTSTVTVTVNSTAAITVGSPVPATPSVGQAVAFALTYNNNNGAGSPIQKLTVEWGDGQVNNFSGAPASISHVYNSPGGYLVLVTGSDALGDTSSGSSSVTVSPRARPTVTISSSTSNPQPNSPVTFTIVATATTGNTIIGIVVDFGDGSSAALAGGAGSVQHVYTASGTYQVTATATDTTGQTGQGSTIIVVSDVAGPAPTAGFTISPTTGTTKTTFNFDGSDSTGNIVSYTWNFGDGKTETNSGPTTTHNYSATGTGTYTIRLTVTDNRGRTATKTATLTVTS